MAGKHKRKKTPASGETSPPKNQNELREQHQRLTRQQESKEGESKQTSKPDVNLCPFKLVLHPSVHRFLSRYSFPFLPFLPLPFLLEDHTVPLLPHLPGLQLTAPRSTHALIPAHTDNNDMVMEKRGRHHTTSMCKNHAGGKKATRTHSSLHHPLLARSFALSIQQPKTPRFPPARY